MADPNFAHQTGIGARAVFVGQRLDLERYQPRRKRVDPPPLVDVGRTGRAVLFEYGVVVFFGVERAEQLRFTEELLPNVDEPFEEPREVEEMDLLLDEQRGDGVESGRIRLRAFSPERLQLVADVLAKSVVLSRYEASIGGNFDRIEPIALTLQEKGRGGRRGRELLRHIGEALIAEGKMVGRLQVHESPELLWEHPELERFYLRLAEEYDLRERHTALERKLDIIARTAQTVLDLMQHRSTLRVEWYIVILIVVEIFLTLYELFIHG